MAKENGFNDINETEREQIWGITLSDKSTSTLFIEKWKELSTRLAAQRLRKLTIERDPSRKQEIYEFPDQFNAVIEKIKPFIEEDVLNNKFKATETKIET